MDFGHVSSANLLRHFQGAGASHSNLFPANRDMLLEQRTLLNKVWRDSDASLSKMTVERRCSRAFSTAFLEKGGRHEGGCVSRQTEKGGFSLDLLEISLDSYALKTEAALAFLLIGVLCGFSLVACVSAGLNQTCAEKFSKENRADDLATTSLNLWAGVLRNKEINARFAAKLK